MGAWGKAAEMGTPRQPQPAERLARLSQHVGRRPAGDGWRQAPLRRGASPSLAGAAGSTRAATAAASEQAEPQPFVLRASDEELADLQLRLKLAKFPDQLQGLYAALPHPHPRHPPCTDR